MIRVLLAFECSRIQGSNGHYAHEGAKDGGPHSVEGALTGLCEALLTVLETQQRTRTCEARKER